MPDKVERRCGHYEDFPPPKDASKLAAKIARFRSKLCHACSAVNETRKVMAAQKAAAEARTGLIAQRREAVFGRVPDELRGVLTYAQINSLSGELASALVVWHLVPQKELADRGKGALRKLATDWFGFGKVVEYLTAGGWHLRMGYTPGPNTFGPYFASVATSADKDEQWLGMRGHTLQLAGCKTGLMVFFKAWPPGWSVVEMGATG